MFIVQAALKIIELYTEGYRQDWGLSFQKDTVSRGGWYVHITFLMNMHSWLNVSMPKLYIFHKLTLTNLANQLPL